MNTLQTSIKDHIATIRLDRGSSNAMSLEMINELNSLIENLENDNDVSVVIITGKDNFFTSGLDLFEIYELNESEIKTFWIKFLELQSTLISFKKPLIAAINGHSPAGGCIMAICCDYRIMAEGKFIIGLNELPVGIIVPDFVFQLYAFWIGERNASQYLLEGRLLNVTEALEVGLIDKVCASEELLISAENKLKTYFSIDPETWSQSKLNIRREIIDRFNSDHTDTLDKILKQWWAPETRNRLKLILQNLKQTATQAI